MTEALRKDKQIWDLFTKKEEYDPPIVDKFGRFPYYLSSQQDVLEPKVSAYLIEQGRTYDFPDDRSFAIHLSHDIDILHLPNISIAFDVASALKHGQLRKALKASLRRNKQWNPFWNFQDIVDLESDYGAKSTFYFHATNSPYDLASLGDDLQLLTDHGFEVGLHSDCYRYNEADKLKDEKERLECVLGSAVSGFRTHFLRFSVPETWELLSKVGVEYDASFGFAGCAGFRNGMCHPFYPFNLTTQRKINVLELPLHVMDATLFDYMRLDSKGAWTIAKRLIDVAEKYNGVLSILWHNNHLAGEPLELYTRILAYCRDKNAWMTTGSAIADWAKKTWKL